MAGFLRSKSPIAPPTAALASAVLTTTRPSSDFDAGINSSTAWTEHLERNTDGGSLSDEELEYDPDYTDETGRPARALYNFEGKPEFRELSVPAGAEIEVLKEELVDGWSFVKYGREVGLLPRSYYTFTADFGASPGGTTFQSLHPAREPSTSSGSATPPVRPLIPQNTGEWIKLFPSFRQSLLGGKSLNRFSAFVTSGAEDWVLRGGGAPEPAHTRAHTREATEASVYGGADVGGSVGGDSDHHFVDAGLKWTPKVPSFRVLVHSPSKRTSTLSGSYIMYSVTSVFHAGERTMEDEDDDDETPPASPTRVTVHRRFSHFVALHTALTRRLSGIALPPLPEKQYAGRFSEDFVEARRGDLERYINRLVRHPIARYAEVLTSFLSCDSDVEWKKLLTQHLSLPPAGPSFYARVFHPAFNLDAEDASETVDRFDAHTRAVSKGVQGLRGIFGQVREARVGMSRAERLLSYALLSLITAKPLASGPSRAAEAEDEDEPSRGKGVMNEDGAWCWRENCDDCLKLTKTIQRAADTLQSVADLYDDHARRTQLHTHEALKSIAHPSPVYAPVVETHRSTLSRYQQALQDGRPDEEVAQRCETVLNTTMAEMDAYHALKVEDFSNITKEHLDGEIRLYEQVLSRLKGARQAFDAAAVPGARQASIFERELENPRLTAPPLPQPPPHVFDSQPMRPVTVAIQEGVGVLAGVGRASVFSVTKFW